MKTAAIIPVKPFAHAKTRLDLPARQKEDLCMLMLDEILRVLAISPRITETVVVTGEQRASELCSRHGATTIPETSPQDINGAISAADQYLLERGFDASLVLPQDIPFIKTQDIDFVFQYALPPNFAIVVPSRRFDGTNALARMPIDLMGTFYDQDSYKIHMNTARQHTSNASLVFVRRIMWDIDNLDDLEFLLQHDEKPDIAEKIRSLLKSGRHET